MLNYSLVEFDILAGYDLFVPGSSSFLGGIVGEAFLVFEDIADALDKVIGIAVAGYVTIGQVVYHLGNTANMKTYARGG